MTAYKVIDDHRDLSNVGDVVHTEIDNHISGTSFLVVSGSGPVPPNGRRLVAGSGISIADGGPGGDLVISTTATPGTGSNIAWAEIPSGSADGSNTLYGLAFTPVPDSALMFYVNGVLQRQGVDCDYTLSGSLVTLAYSPRSGSNLTAMYPY